MEGCKETQTTPNIDTTNQKSGWELGQKRRWKSYGICGSSSNGVHTPPPPKSYWCCNFCLLRRTMSNVPAYQTILF
jgi:hypothetical protein